MRAREYITGNLRNAGLRPFLRNSDIVPIIKRVVNPLATKIITELLVCWLK